MADDSIIDGHRCRKVTGQKVDINKYENGYDTVQQQSQFIYTSGDTVFYYNRVFSRFLVLYNFDVKVGDTVTYHVPYMFPGRPDTTFQLEVSDVRMTDIGGIKLKTITHRDLPMSLFSIRTMMERTGAFHAHDIIGHQLVLDIPRAGGLRCYSDQVIDTARAIPKFGCEELRPLGLKEQVGTGMLKLFPNPAQGSFTVTYPAVNRLQFEIMDVSGRTYTVPQQHSQQNTSFDIHSLADGLYFLKVSGLSETGTGMLKFLKTGL
ncbi:MAG: T9SS type A sorting domain-containing protein [Chitinophagaceae bacterium]|nr:T9SS type A sorting domain-containing protein [Chitinophagaceae bacterium]